MVLYILQVHLHILYMYTVCYIFVALYLPKEQRQLLYTRLLHPQHLDGIWIGQDQYRMPLASLSEYPEPWF